MHVRLDVVRQRGGFRQPRKHVERGQRARRLLNARRLGRDTSAQLFEQLDLALENALVGAQHLLFVFLQRRRDEPLAAGDRLLAVIVGRDRVQIRLRDLDVVAEHAVVAHLQRVDAGARALALFELGDHLFARSADAPQVVELGVEAVANIAAVAHERARLVDQAAVDVVAHVDEVVERADQRPGERRLARLEDEAHARHDRNRLLQADEIARPRTAERGTRDEALEILHALQDLAELAAVGAAEGELLDGVQAIANAIERDERAQQPRAQQPPRHGGDRAIDLVEQGALAAAIHRFDDFEMLERDRVDEQAIGRCLVGDAADVREVGFLRVAQIVEQGAGGRHRGRVSVEPEAFEPVRAELVEQRAPRRFVLERPRLDACHRQPIAGAVEQHAAQIEIDRPRQSRAAAAPSLRPPAPAGPPAPAYSAQENSPVVRSSSATPNDAGQTPVFVRDFG